MINVTTICKIVKRLLELETVNYVSIRKSNIFQLHDGCMIVIYFMNDTKKLAHVIDLSEIEMCNFDYAEVISDDLIKQIQEALKGD